MEKQLSLPVIPTSKITAEIMMKVDAMVQCISFAKDITQEQQRLALDSGIPAASQRRYCSQLRKLFELPRTTPLSIISHHPQLRQALEVILTRKEHRQKNELVSARRLVRVNPVGGEMVDLSDWLLALYCHPGNNAVATVRTLRSEVRAGRILVEDETGARCAEVDDLPSERTITRWLSRQEKERKAVKRSRLSRSERIKDQFYVSRPDEEYRPGGKLEGDHTEDNTVLFREDGKMAPLWVTALVDARTGLCKAYNLCYRPNSDSIAITTRRAITGEQLRAATTRGTFEPVNIIDAPDMIVYDNGKDYRSKYASQVIGKVDFTDDARKTVQRICDLRHTLVRSPQSKPHVENWFKLVQEVLKNLPGFKGRNYEAKPDSLSSEMRQGALLTEQEFRELFQLAFDTVNNRERESLGGLSPIQCYLMHQHQARYVDPRVLDFLMLKVKDRRVRQGYVRLLNEDYFAPELDDYNGALATLYYDPLDVGKVAVYVGGECCAIAINKNRLGMTEREMLTLVRERAKMNKELNEEIRSLRMNMTSEEAKAWLFTGEIANVSAVEKKLLERKTPVVVSMLGIESDAKELQQKLETANRQIEADKKRDEAKKTKNPLSLINVEKIR